MATVAITPDQDAVVAEIFVAAPPSRVFEAITDPKQVPQWWGQQGMQELQPVLLESTYVTESMLEEFRARYRDPHYWTSVITFTANWGRKPA